MAARGRGPNESKQGRHVASIAFDSSDAQDVSRPPISLHPAFPAVVALWFAALLGVGSMVLPVVLLERAVTITGLASLVPAASPPLGFTARGLIALAATLVGAVIGIVIARRVARAHDAARPSRAAKFARRPISVNEELGGERLVNGFGLPVNRRRALAIAEDDRPSDFLYMAPLPGNDEDDPGRTFEAPAAAPAEEPFELSDAFEDDESDADAWHEPNLANETGPMTFTQEFQPLASEPRARQEFRPQPAKRESEPLAFSAPSLARRVLEPEPLASDEPEQELSMPEPVRFEAVPPSAAPQALPADWSSAPIGELGLVQLVQRLGASLERRREWLATAAAAVPSTPLAPPVDFEPAAAEDAAQAMAAYFGKPAGDPPAPAEAPLVADIPAPPASLPNAWPVTEDEDEADVMASFTLPLRKAVAPTIAFDEPADLDEPAADETDDSYSSLLAMRNPFAPKTNGFVRIDEPEDDDAVEPAVVFPGHGESTFTAPAAGLAEPRPFDPPGGSATAPHRPPADADAALRAALATLQRMSSTA